MKPAIAIGKDNPLLVGYLIGLAISGRNKSRVYEFRTEDGQYVRVWGSSDIDRNLLDETGKTLETAYYRKLVRIKFIRERFVDGYNLPFRDLTVEVDVTKTLGNRVNKPAKTSV